MSTRRIFKTTALVIALLVAGTTGAGGGAAVGQQQQPQGFIRYDRFESEREDRLTGGHIERAEFEPGQPDIKLTLNVPSFRLTLWQNGKEVKSYSVGVGMKDYPIYIGEREAREIGPPPPRRASRRAAPVRHQLRHARRRVTRALHLSGRLRPRHEHRRAPARRVEDERR